MFYAARKLADLHAANSNAQAAATGGVPADFPPPAKKPSIPGWQNLNATEADIDGWFHSYPEAINTGVLTRTTPAVDIDVLDGAVAEELETLLWNTIGARGMVRFGLLPKRAMLFRTEAPFKKIATPLFTSPSGTKNKVEVLCDGQQVVVFGTRPDTGKPYSWHGGQPGDVPRVDLPELTEAVAREFVAKAAAIMRSRGWIEDVRKPNGEGARLDLGAGDEFDAIYGGRERKYALAAWQGCADELAGMAPNSRRNNKLNALAFRLGTMSARGWISQDEVQSGLFAAAAACGLVAADGETATRATLESGLGNGERKPHPDLPDETAPTVSDNPPPAVELFWHGELDARPARSWLVEKADSGAGYWPNVRSMGRLQNVRRVRSQRIHCIRNAIRRPRHYPSGWRAVHRR